VEESTGGNAVNPMDGICIRTRKGKRRHRGRGGGCLRGPGALVGRAEGAGGTRAGAFLDDPRGDLAFEGRLLAEWEIEKGF